MSENEDSKRSRPGSDRFGSLCTGELGARSRCLSNAERGQLGRQGEARPRVVWRRIGGMSVVRFAKRRGGDACDQTSEAGDFANSAHRLGIADEKGVLPGVGGRLKGFPGALALDAGGEDVGRAKANGHG